ncbi:MAG: hypothetical protein NTX63_01860 [Candidatus Peregrinibacteria bacterium]|nr:hypothetical protein [Candidatus Peregrinibacteria bacterium]
MANYPTLHKLFDGVQSLEDGQRETLRVAIAEGLDSAITQKANISALAGEVRRCVESLRLYPESLEGNEAAKDTLIGMFNARAVRPIVEMIWSKVRETRSLGGTVVAN